MFADVVGSTALADRMDPEDWSTLMRSVLSLMAAPVERYGGTVLRLMGDGLLAVFGAPTAHEDDPIRAVNAGLDMVATVAGTAPTAWHDVGEQPAIRVGINTGLAIVEVTDAGGALSDVMGDTVNVAARMQSAARPGTLLVTAETWRHGASVFHGLDLGVIEVKGKPEPIAVWEVEGRRDDPGSTRGLAGISSPLVGREEPLRQLTAGAAAASSGNGHAALLLGDAGVGKSRLLAELRARNLAAGDRGLRWIEARSVSYGSDVPYGLLSDLIRAALTLPKRADGRESMHAVEGRVAELLRADGRPHAVALGHLLSLPLSEGDAQELAPLTPEALRARYAAATEAVLRAISGAHPVALVADDVHWADASSIEVLRRLLPVVRELPLLVVISARPEHDSPGWHLVEGARETFGAALAEVSLLPLDTVDSRSLVANLLEVESLPDKLRDFILSSAEGNPFFVEELIRMLIDRGWITSRDGRWVGSATVASAQVPPTLEGLLTARLDRLARPALQVLKTAAVIGRDIPLRLLEDIVGAPTLAASAMSRAEAAGLVQIASVDPEPVFRFRHALIQEAAYASLLKADRRRLHREVGSAIEAREPDRLDELAPILGLHFERGADPERAAAYLHRAARAAMRRFAVREARDLLDRASVVFADLPDDEPTNRRRVEVDLDRVDAGVTFIPYHEELELLAAARRRAEALGDERLLGLALAREARIRALQGDGSQSEALDAAIDGAIAIGRRLDDSQIIGVPLAIKGLLLSEQGRRAEAIATLEDAVARLEDVATDRAAFYAGQLGVINAEVGDFAAAARAALRSRELAERSGDPNALADVDIFEGMAVALEGRHDEALELARRGASGAKVIGNLSCEATGSFLAGEQELALGNLGAAIDWLEKANDIAVYCRAADVERLSAATLQAARAMSGEGTEALHGLDGLLDQARAVGDRLSEGKILLRRAEAHATAANGLPAQARSDVDAATTIFRALGATPYLDRAARLRDSLAGNP